MQLPPRVTALYKENRLNEMVAYILELLQNSQQELPYEIELYEYLLEGYEKLRCISEWEEAVYELAVRYRQIGQNVKALQLLEEVLHRSAETPSFARSDFYKWIKLLIDSCIEEGELAKAHQCFEECLGHLYRRRNIKKGLSCAEEFLRVAGDKSIVKMFQFKFYAISNQVEQIEVLLAEYLDKYFDKIELIPKQQFDEIESILDQEMEFKEDSKVLYQFKLLLRLAKLLNSEGDLRIKKEYVNLLYEYLVKYPQDSRGIFFALEYALLAKRGPILEVINSLCKTTLAARQDAVSVDICNKIKQMEEINNYFDAEFEAETRFDLGEDLFQEENREQEKVTQIVREIKLLAKHQGDIMPLIEELKKISPGHELIRQFEVDNNKELPERILAEIAEEETEEFQRSDIAFARAVRHFEPTMLSQNYKDLIIAFKMMGMKNAALALQQHVEEEGLVSNELKSKLEFEYLRITVLNDTRQYYEAIARLEEIVHTWPIQQEERVCFLYLMAEIYRALGQKSLAAESYKQVFKLNPHYRLVRQRMKEIGAN